MERYLFFVSFIVFLLIMLLLDLGVFHKKDHAVGMKEAGFWTLAWVLLAMIFGLVIRFHAEWIHGINDNDELVAQIERTGLSAKIDTSLGYEESLSSYRKELYNQYLAGYFLEESLSIDNIFVMLLIFTGFGIDKRYYHRVLFWGIFGAIVLRFIFIFSLGALVERFSWLLALFGVVLLFSAGKMVKGDEEQVDTQNHPVVKAASKHFPLYPKVEDHSFFKRIDGRSYMTPLFLVLLVIEFSDIVFAVDSIPAVFSVTKDSFVVYFSNIFAIMGLRSMFFLLSDMNDKFWFLRYGLGALLGFIGVEMLAENLPPVFGMEGLDVSTTVSLAVILAILVASIAISLIFPRKKEPKNN